MRYILKIILDFSFPIGSYSTNNLKNEQKQITTQFAIDNIKETRQKMRNRRFRTDSSIVH